MFDHATPIGELVVASPTHYRIVAEFHGRAAHAGVRPEAGRSAIAAAARAIAAMRLGRLDAQTTANVGMIEGGTAINVVPERCRIEAEVRSLDDARAAQVTTEIVDHLEDAANATECDLDLDVAQMFSGYRTNRRHRRCWSPSAPCAPAATSPSRSSPAGASDANSFRAAGFACTCLADGVEHNHEPTERVSAQALETMLEIAIALVDEAAVELAPAMSEFELIESTTQWRGAVFSAGVETFRYADGARVTREKVWHPGAVGILPVDDAHVWLTRQPREAAGLAASLEIPAGKLDVPGEPPLDTAKRELAEEIGKRAASWREIDVFYTSPGFSDERVWLFLGARPIRRSRRRARSRRADRGRAVAARGARRGDRRVRGLQVADRAAVAGARARARHALTRTGAPNRRSARRTSEYWSR